MMLALFAFFAGALVVAVVVHSAALYRRQRELVGVARPPVVVLELEPVYPNGATGALFRSSLGELEARATTTDEAERQLFPATFEVPCNGARGFRVRVYPAAAGLAGIYAGETVAVEHESEPPPDFLRSQR